MSRSGDRWVFGVIVASAGAVLVSIAASQILLTLALLIWIVWRPSRPQFPPYFVPLLAIMLTTLLSLAFSPEPEIGWGPVRKFVLFSMGVTTTVFVNTPGRARKAISVLILFAASSSVMALVQFGIKYARFLKTGEVAADPLVLFRITGFMGHWMTFGGEQLMVWCAAIPALPVIGLTAALLPLFLIGSALILSFTRSAWLAAVVGSIVASASLPRRQLIVLLLPVMLMSLASSGLILERLSRSFEPGFEPDLGRVALFQAGLRMIWDNPVFGVGPERVSRTFPSYYTGTNLGTFYYGHLHNNFLQLGAERGLLCLASFVWFLASLYSNLARMLKTLDPAARWTAFSALAALTGFVVEGFFEYNFGDSEILLLLLFIVSIPFGIQNASVGKQSYSHDY